MGRTAAVAMGVAQGRLIGDRLEEARREDVRTRRSPRLAGLVSHCRRCNIAVVAGSDARDAGLTGRPSMRECDWANVTQW